MLLKASTIDLFPGLLTMMDSDVRDMHGWREELRAVICQHEQLADALEGIMAWTECGRTPTQELLEAARQILRLAGRNASEAT